MTKSDMFVTVFYGVLDITAGVLRFSRAGHDRPLLINPHTGKCQPLDSQGTALGVIEYLDLEEVEVEVYPGDLLLLFTDGITDANSPSGEIFGIERLRNTACNMVGISATQACNCIFEEVQEFMGGSDQFDDMAVLVVSMDS
jgi:sigma-B regulation protein RsbU (phosphoserine phosphatase)